MRRGEASGSAGAPLLLTAREAARGPADASPSSSAVATAAFGASRVAALFASSDGARVQLGVFHVASDRATSTAYSEGSRAGPLVDLLSEEEQRRQLEAEDASATTEHESSKPTRADRSDWSLAWSPDGGFLVVVGSTWRGQEDGKQAAVWMYASSQWMGVSPASTRLEGLLIRAHPSDYVPAKRWKPTASIAAAFFRKNRLFLLSHDSVLLAADIQMARLAILAADDAEPSKEEIKGVFKMSLAKNVAEWHAGITAACFDAATSTLVISGGVRNPSEDLVAANASSLSVWRVGESASDEEAIELLDYTMVLNPTASSADAETALIDGEQEPGIVSSLLKPLKFMVGAGAREEKQSLPGSIRQLALATDGNYVAMLDSDGKLAVRQIDTCADVVAWQPLASILSAAENIEAPQQEVKSVSWLTRTQMALLLESGKVVYAELTFSSSEDDPQDDVDGLTNGENAGANGTLSASLRRVASYCYVPTFSDSTLEQTWRVDSLNCSSAPDSTPATCSAVVTLGDAWIATVIHQAGIGQFVELLVSAGRVDDALAITERHGLGNEGVDIDALHRRVWAEFCSHATTNVTSDGEDAKQNVLSPREQSHHSAAVFLQTLGLPAEGSYSFASAIHHLAQVKDQWWVLDECLRVAAADSFDGMKQILATGWGAASNISSGSTTETLSEDAADELATKREQLLRSLYRLETLRIIVEEEEESGVAPEGDSLTSRLEADTLFNGPAFLWFASNPLLDTATHLALEGRVVALSVLFRRHAWNLLPFRIQVLSKIPAIVSPVSYAHLLPAIPSFASDSQFYSLAKLSRGLPVESSYSESDDVIDAVEVNLVPENQSHDLTADELVCFESKAQQSSSERGEEYAVWFKSRILDIDGLQGQLEVAYQLSRLSSSCLAGWTSSADAKREFDEFLMEVERLYKCVYLLPQQLPACSMLTLSDWMAIPFYQQAMMVVGKIESVSAAIERLRLVILAQRRDRLYALDELFSWIAQSVLFESPSLVSLELCAQMIQLSNPSLPLQDRWIQSDSHLLRTAIGVVFSAQTSTVIGEASQHQPHPRVQHTALTELLWSIFQSLPVRKDDDPPDIAHLQVEVDEMEDLMVAMDVLAKYGILTTPCELKKDVLSPETNGLHEVLEQMCLRYLVPTVGAVNQSTASASPEEVTPTMNTNDGSQWMEVWQDAIKLKQHVFGERLAQEDILDTILGHLLAQESYVNAAHDLAVNWILSNVEATDHVMNTLMAQLQARLDSPCDFPARDAQQATDAVVAKYVEILRAMVALPVVQEWDPLRSERLEEFFQLEINLVYASQLLALMTSGAVMQPPSSIRALTNANERLDLVVQVLTSNPSNYQPSHDTKRWLEAHQLDDEYASSIGDETRPLSAVMYLAGLLQVDSFKQDIMMKGAYAALYCSDFDVAYMLTMAVINDEEDANASSGSAGVPLLHVVSLVLDLVSASSFRSWTKKIALCRSIFSMQATGSGINDDLFSHQVTDLLLLWLQKLEATQDLALELGLSERNVEKRLAGEISGGGIEDVLLKEVEVVIDLLQQEKRDRAFLLRLLQKGFHLLCVTVSFNPEAANGTGLTATSDNNDADRQFAEMIVRMARLCLEVGVEGALGGDDAPENGVSSVEANYLELGFTYLLLWNDLCEDDDDAVKALWETDLLPRLFDQVAAANANETTGTSSPTAKKERVIRQFHHYFLYAAASMEVNGAQATTDGDGEITWRAKRERLDAYASSYESLRGRMSQASTLHVDGEDSTDDFQEDNSSATVLSSPRFKLFMSLAAKCQAQLASQQKSHEMEKVSAFFNESLDVEAFATDEQYRTQQILWLATKKEQFQAATQFAEKYSVDRFQCVLAYIKSALLPASDALPSASGAVSRHEQLERAFQSDDTDFLELALQRPVAFGDFLLRGDAGNASVYDSLDGSDHVGVLLALRMVLECAKRISAAQQAADGGFERMMAEQSGEDSLFPLPKESVDRATLVFMCMKRLKDQLDARDDVPTGTIDLKRVCRAATSHELLSVPVTDESSALVERQAAVQAVIPLLTGKSVKIVTKVLQKLYRVTASSIVTIYLNALLDSIWVEHGGNAGNGAMSSDLASYAYEACLPFLPVLSNEHLALFVTLLLGKSWTQSPMLRGLDLEHEFYGQSVDTIARFAPLMAADKRVEIVSDALLLLHTRFKSFRASMSAEDADQLAAVELKTRELEAMQSELVEACVWMVLTFLKQDNSAQDQTPKALEDFEATWSQWCELDDDARQLESRAYMDHLLLLLFEVSGHSASSVRPLVLMAELLFFLARASEEDAAPALAQCVRTAVVRTAHEELALGDADSGDHWPGQVALAWATRFPSAPDSSLANESMGRLSRYLTAFTATQALTSAVDDTDASYYQLVQRLGELSSPFLKAVASIRMEARAANQPLLFEVTASAAAVGAWNDLIVECEARELWSRAAVASQLLLGAIPESAANHSELALRHFGLQARAIWHAVLAQNQAGDAAIEHSLVFDGPAMSVSERFTEIYDDFLRKIEESSSSTRFAQMATRALGNMLYYHTAASRSATELPATRLWAEEQRHAVSARVAAQFHMEPASFPGKPGSNGDDADAESSCLWSALLVRGAWPNGDDDGVLVNWYEQLAFGHLRSSREAVEQFVVARWEMHRVSALHLLLMCPFDDLRAQFEAQILVSVAQLLETPSPRNSSLLELCLLRFDVSVLVRTSGLYPSIVAFLLPPTGTSARRHRLLRWPRVWTSSSDYVVCALVASAEYAAAGRLACALWRVHPMLWDFENAQLVLANLVRAMAAQRHQKRQDNVDADVRRQVFEATRAHLERERLL